ncbi:endolytic transglycosylase MltG [Oricola sp.]|uniref:endolytic transglycosylase MltG n=1 Tax=Oricola sp. TaxID=1979950 RepID=UPI0032049035
MSFTGFLLKQIIGLALLLGLFLAAAQADRRVALVIGNADYRSEARLRNPRNDADDVAAAFERLGFAVEKHHDLTFAGMRRALRSFARDAAGADMAVVFFAGHGMEVGGRNYLIPTDAELATDLDLDYEAFEIETVVNAVSRADGLKLVILDACRDNPFAVQMELTRQSRSIGRGFKRVEPNDGGTLIAYSAAAGTTADDGNGRNSPYTQALLEHLEEPGLEIRLLFGKVRDTVFERTSRQAKRQRPAEYGSLPGRAIYLIPPDSGGGNPPPHSVETVWATLEGTDDIPLLEAFRQQYGADNPYYDTLAMRRIEAVSRAGKEGSGTVAIHSVTVDAGMTVAQALKRIRENEFLTGAMPEDTPKEGMLAAGTRKFPGAASRSALVAAMQAEQREMVEEIWAKRRGDLPLKDINAFVTLASIVEKETAIAGERPRVAGVFVNRLRKGMKLQSDSTLIYGLFGGEGRPADYVLKRSDLEKITPYNTYKVQGLPPGPIAIPSRASLEAVANPSANDELYFVSDGDGGHVFAKTLSDHNTNVRRWREIERNRAEGKGNSGASSGGDRLAMLDSAAQSPAADAGVPIPVMRQKAIFYQERSGSEAGTAVAGATVWSIVQESPGGSAPAEPAIRAETTIPEYGLTMEMTIRRNVDESLPASHVIELFFRVPDTFNGLGIADVQRITFKETEQEPGNALVGVAAPIDTNVFLIALTRASAATTANLDLMRGRQWIDIPMQYVSGRRALIVLEKGDTGQRVFDEVLAAWKAS